MTLFTGRKFYVPNSLLNSAELRSLLSCNGGEVVQNEDQIDGSVVCVLDSFDFSNVSTRFCADGASRASFTPILSALPRANAYLTLPTLFRNSLLAGGRRGTLQ
jgi:hypothetical protein